MSFGVLILARMERKSLKTNKQKLTLCFVCKNLISTSSMASPGDENYVLSLNLLSVILECDKINK